MGVIGMDYAECRASAADLGIEWGLDLFRKIQALERFTLDKISASKEEG